MTDLQTDTLLKPDMGAVLSRTHLQVNVHGFLLPIFEAISNAMHGVEERFGEEAKSAGVLHISFRHWNNPTKIIITVSDNGSGLNDDNFKSFKTPFSGYKLKQKGRGFGRFIAFKVFNKAVYQSRYEFFKNETTRSFRFDIGQDSEFIFVGTKPSFSGPGVCVEYGQP
jgi:sensor histidine kinase regulating citrate/malate metabolism